MPINQSKLVFVGNVVWLGVVYYFAYSFLYAIIPEFMEYWSLGLCLFILFASLYVNDISRGNNLINFILVTGMDFALSFILSDFGDLVAFFIGVNIIG